MAKCAVIRPQHCESRQPIVPGNCDRPAHIPHRSGPAERSVRSVQPGFHVLIRGCIGIPISNYIPLWQISHHLQPAGSTEPCHFRTQQGSEMITRILSILQFMYKGTSSGGEAESAGMGRENRPPITQGMDSGRSGCSGASTDTAICCTKYSCEALQLIPRNDSPKRHLPSAGFIL